MLPVNAGCQNGLDNLEKHLCFNNGGICKSLPDLEIQTRKLHIRYLEPSMSKERTEGETLFCLVCCALVSWRKRFCVRFARSNKLSWIRGVTRSSAPISFYRRPRGSASSRSLAFVCQRGNNSCCFHRIFLPGVLGGGGGEVASNQAALADRRPFVSSLSLPTAHTLLSVRGTREELSPPLVQLLLSPV